MYLRLFISCCLVLGIQSAFDFFSFGKKGDAAAPVFPRINAADIKPLSDEALRGRGMTAGMKERYLPVDAPFVCDNGAKRLPHSSINDGFCDCADGADEPGTSACSGLLKDGAAAAAKTFQCVNKGYKLVQIPASRVDDAVCDCCDGSDEGSLVQCPDVCTVIAAKEIEHLTKLTAAYKAGSAIREQYIKKVEVETTSKAAPLAYLRQEIERQQAAVDALRDDKDAESARIDERAEQAKGAAAESAKAVLGLESMSQGDLVPLLVHLFDLLSLAEHEVNAMVDPSYSSGSSSVLDDDYKRYDHYDDHKDAATGDSEDIPEQDVLDSMDHIDGQPADDALPHASLEEEPSAVDTSACVLRAAAGLSGPDARFSALCALEEGKQLAEARQLLLKVVQDKAAYLEVQLLVGYRAARGGWDGVREEVSKDLEAAREAGQVCPAPLEQSRAGSCAIAEGLRSVYAQLAAALSEGERPAAAKFADAESRLRHLEGERDEAEEAAGHLEKLQGKLAFLALKGQCFEQKDGKFTYSMCTLGDITQRDGDSSHGTRLGSFASIEDGPAGAYVMRFTEGDHCHAFGARKADVAVTCGADNRLLSASEPSTCHYSFVLETPAACTDTFAEANGLAAQLGS